MPDDADIEAALTDALADPTVGMASMADGSTSRANINPLDLIKARNLLRSQQARAEGRSPMFCRGRVTGLPGGP